MAVSITDVDLRRELKDLGYDAGPITSSTRSVYLKKLEKLKKGLPNKTSRLSLIESSKVKHTGTNSTGSPIKVTKYGESVRSLPDELNEAIKNDNCLLKDTSSRFVANRNDKTSKRLGVESIRTSCTNRESLHSANSLVSSNRNQTDLSCDIVPQRSAGHTPTRKTYIYYTDDVNSPDNLDLNSAHFKSNPVTSTLSRVVGFLNRSDSKSSYNLQKRKSLNRTHTSVDNYMHISDTDNSDAECTSGSMFNGFCRSLIKTAGFRNRATATSSSLLFSPSGSPERSKKFSDAGYSIISEDVDTRTTQNLNNTYNSCNQLSKCGDYLKSIFSLTVSSIPNMILLSSLLLLMGLAISYIVLKDHHGEVGKFADVQKLICEHPSDKNFNRLIGSRVSMLFVLNLSQNCLDQSEVAISLKVFSTLYDVLSLYAGEYYCKYSSLSSPQLLVQSAKGLVQHQLEYRGIHVENFQHIWENSLILLLHIGKRHFNLRAVNTFGHELGPLNLIDQISQLESLRPFFPGICRINRWFNYFCTLCFTAFWIILGATMLLLILYGLHLIRLRRLKAFEQRSHRIREIVSEVVYLLQNQLRLNEVDQDQPAYVPLFVLRDHLRQKYEDITIMWPEVVRHVYQVETCIGVQEWRGVGETWKWQGGSGWQGSALIDKHQKPSFLIPPTPCLKVRNMYSTDDTDDLGKQRIKMELLNKLASCGSIVHIGFDNVGVNGLVYIKCADATTAGRIYHSIHANYFDGRLLMVKFLRDEKYCIRFPEAQGLMYPICMNDESSQN